MPSELPPDSERVVIATLLPPALSPNQSACSFQVPAARWGLAPSDVNCFFLSLSLTFPD